MADEQRAKHVLAEMQVRLARSAYDALDIQAGAAGPAEVRAAFLSLTKIYHPARFARMSPEVRTLANEVFLGLRAAHDQLARAKPRPPTPPPSAGKTPSPEMVKQNTTPARERTQPMPRVNVGSAPPAPTKAIDPPTQPRVSQSGPTPPRLNAVGANSTQPIARPNVPPSTPRPPLNARPTPSTGLKRPQTPAHGVPVVTPPARPPAGGVPRGGVEPELVGVYDQLQRGEFEQARTTLNALIALQPKPRYKALLQYSIGREAQLSRRLDDARIDLQGALEIDPELQVAKTALAELFTRRK